MDPIKHKKAFQNSLLGWFSNEGKDYPWRRTQDPWEILVSEVMLQQTLVKTVLGFYEPFLKKFPSPIDLAKAPESEILSAWEGLGYYRRVRNLQKAAKAICDYHQGEFPRDYESIRALPGIGRYTAGAVASFAYNDRQPIVDANVARVFARLFHFTDRIDTTAGEKQLWSWAESLVHDSKAREYNSALMELGQTYCTNKSPDCSNCPVKRFCSTSEPERLPVKKAKRSTVLVDQFCIFTYRQASKHSAQPQVLLMQEAEGQRREGMWKLPERTYEETLQLPLLYKANYAITHHKVTLRIYLSENSQNQQKGERPSEAWFSLNDIDSTPMPSPFRKAITNLLKDYI